MRRSAHAGAHQKCRDHQSRHDADPTSHDDTLQRRGPFPPPVGVAKPVFGSTAELCPARFARRLVLPKAASGQRVVDISLIWIGESNESARITQLVPCPMVFHERLARDI